MQTSHCHLLRITLVAFCSLALLSPAVSATPAEEISRAVEVNKVEDVSSAPPRQFLKALNAVALRTQPRELPNYVIAAISLRQELAPNITAVAIKAAIKNSKATPDSQCGLVNRIITAAITAHSEAVVAIVKAASSAAPELRRCTVNAAISRVPAEKEAILRAADAKAVPFAFLTFSASEQSGFSFTAATLNPANISDLGDDNVNSPEQPPAQ